MNPWRSLAALLMMLLLSSCGQRAGNSSGNDAASAAEAEVVGELLAISESEVSITDMIDSLMTASDVTTLAERINMDHISVSYSVKGLPSTENETARSLLAARDSFAAVMRATPPESLPRVYLEHELRMHARYKPLLDAMALKVVNAEDLKNIVERLRQVEDLHVSHVERVLKELHPK